MTSAADFLTPETAWFLRYGTAIEASEAASRILGEQPEIEAVLLWPASTDLAWRPERWYVLYVNELSWPNYHVVARPGYDPVPAISGGGK